MSASLSSGMQLMLIGMGTVFFFLTLLVFATSLMSRIVLRLQPLADSSMPLPGPSADVSPDMVAAMTAAITAHRARVQHSNTTTSGNRS